MKFFTITAIVLCHCYTSVAQYNYDEYKQMYVGWIKIYNYKGALNPVTVENKTYSKAQLSIVDSFGNWMQASYTPKGSLGDMKKYLSPKTGMYNDDVYNKVLPHSFGVRAVSYVFLKKVNNNYTPVNNLGNHWAISANEIPLNYRLVDYCTDKALYFTLPSYNLKHDDERQELALYDVPSHSSAAKYNHNVVPRVGQFLRINQVLLSKNNISPFVQITIGEALNHLETVLPFKMEEMLAIIRGNNIGRPQEIAIQSEQVRKRFDKAKATLNLLKEKYRNRRNELAFSKSYLISDLENDYDIFSGLKIDEPGTYGTLDPILKIKPEFEKLCSTDKPQWIVVRWWGGELNNEAFKHMHESIINNFDFDYLYQFFFEPEKLNGRKYKPLRSPVYEAPVITKEKSSATKRMETDPSVFYFDDFSTTQQGSTPTGWNSDLNAISKKAVVKTPAGETGNWFEIIGQNVQVNELGKNLPQNFTMSFDACVRKDFQWGVPGLELFIVGNKKSRTVYENKIRVRIRPGFSGRDGWAVTNIETATKNEFPKEVAIPGFSNDKLINKVQVVIRKQGTQLTVWVENNKLFDINDALPANTVFNHFYFSNGRKGWEVEEFYISNIKIKKE
ncbi:hypothetical protein ESA94_03605 [Lacibacter luteus]|uniref:Uncharacterized protein n=1 Tax=Lacibacter luteus TaxID=2508719 RepID=A0A4Q1CN40_9BACT|nr:hypothetical protein [Lacibacter luteus]RXK62111.1 hypothetical protein ESA94_03605 [Lacibacter luteus]